MGKINGIFPIRSIYLNGTNHHNLLLHYGEFMRKINGKIYVENLWGKLMGKIYGENLWGKLMGKINGENLWGKLYMLY